MGGPLMITSGGLQGVAGNMNGMNNMGGQMNMQHTGSGMQGFY